MQVLDVVPDMIRLDFVVFVMELVMMSILRKKNVRHVARYFRLPYLSRDYKLISYSSLFSPLADEFLRRFVLAKFNGELSFVKCIKR